MVAPQVATGCVSSCRTTFCVHEAVFPDRSVALQVEVAVRSEPLTLAVLQLAVTASQLSEACADPAADPEHCPELSLVLRTMVLSQETVGLVSSVSVTVYGHELELPSASIAVQVELAERTPPESAVEELTASGVGTQLTETALPWQSVAVA